VVGSLAMSFAGLRLLGDLSDACERRQRRATEARASIAIEKARAASRLRALTGEGRNSSRSHCARDGHPPGSPPQIDVISYATGRQAELPILLNINARKTGAMPARTMFSGSKPLFDRHPPARKASAKSS
jgi:hypothetical protein